MTKSQEEQDLERSTRFVIEDPRAHDFLWWVLSMCGVYSAPPVVNGETGIHIGRRVIGVSIINQISTVSPTAYAEMMIAAHNRAEARKKEDHDRRDDDE